MNKLPSIGTLLQCDVGATTTLAGISSINFPSSEVQFWDATALDSTYVEDGELAGLSAPGECSGEGFYDPADASQLVLIGDVAKGGKYRNWVISRAPADPEDDPTPICSFTGSIKTFTPKAAVKDGLKVDWSVKLRTMADYDGSDSGDGDGTGGET